MVVSPWSTDRKPFCRKLTIPISTATLSTSVADGLVRIVAPLPEVLGLDIADVQKSISAHSKVDERGLDAWFQVDDFALVDIADVIVLATAFDVELFEQSIFNNRNPAFFRLRDID